jgi:MarR family transcriptional regulator, organic hydroperoxide resistance regulator
MGRKADAKTARELNELLHDMMVAIGHASGSGIVGVVNEADLTLPQIIILGLLLEGPQTVSGLSEMLRLTPGAVSRLVDRMVRKGLVIRREGNDDRRQKMLSPTPAGRRMHHRLERARTGSFASALSELDSTLAKELKNVLKRVVATLCSRSSTPER